AAGAAWRRQLDEHEPQIGFGRQWVAYLEENAATMAARLPELANLVSATTGALAGDPHFGDRAPQVAFDLLVLQEADRATESEFLRLAQRARRWVLVSDADAFVRHGLVHQGDAGTRARGDRRR